MRRYTEDDLQLAIVDVVNGMSLRAASQKWGPPYSTIKNRLRGTESHTQAAQDQQRLSKVQEDYIAD